jgi:hypothetical protein
MGRPRTWCMLSAANARAAKKSKYLLPLPHFSPPIDTAIVEIELPRATGSDSKDIEVTKWTGSDMLAEV